MHLFSLEDGKTLMTSRNLAKQQQLVQGPLNYLFWRDQRMQIYGNFEGIPLYKCIVWIGCIMTPVVGTMKVQDQTKWLVFKDDPWKRFPILPRGKC